jgi:hypothetical protein
MKSENDPIFCRMACPAPVVCGPEMMWMPGGMQTITPVGGGIGQPIHVKVDAAAARIVEQQREAIVASGRSPYFDLNHEDGPASFRPEAFYWKESPAPGIYARGEWTPTGRAAVEGKEFREFSPVFHVDNKRVKPAQIIDAISAGRTKSSNMGGLVNDAAFTEMTPFFAKESREAAGAPSDQPKNNTTMKEEEIAALQAKNKELETELNKLKNDQTALKAKNESDTLVASEIRAKTAELEANKGKLELEGILAKNKDLQAAATKRAEADADRAIEEAVTRGAIAAKDEDTKKQWRAMIIADPTAAALLAKQAGNSVLNKEPISARQKTKVEDSDPRDTAKAYDAIRAKQLQCATTAEKIILSKEMAAIYAADMRDNDRFLNSPIQAGDVTDPNLGTLAGTLVAQRRLELFKLSFGSLLKYITTDFSDIPANFNQTTTTRVEMIPAVFSYDPTLGSDGRPKGYTVTTPAESKDVQITLNQHIATEIVFGANILASTVRNLFDEQTEGQAYALANNVINAFYALFTPANFNYYSALTVAPGSMDRSVIGKASVAMNPAGVPKINRAFLLNSPYYNDLVNDTNLVSFAAFQKPGIVTDAELMPISKFQPLEAESLPATNNLAGVAIHKAATLFQARVPNDYTTILPGAGYGNVAVVTDPDLGISTLVTQYVSHQGGYAAQRQALMYGVAAAIRKAALLLLSSGSLTGTGAGTPDFAS